MNRTTRTTLTLGAAVALAAVALPARADHRCGPGWRCGPAPVAVVPAPAVPAPSIAVTLSLPPAAAPRPVVVTPPVAVPLPAPPPAYEPAHFGWRRAAWELREEYRRLDDARARFYGTWNGNPWRRGRFESWYASRRAELDRRWSELGRWREHREHERWERWDG